MSKPIPIVHCEDDGCEWTYYCPIHHKARLVLKLKRWWFYERLRWKV